MIVRTDKKRTGKKVLLRSGSYGRELCGAVVTAKFVMAVVIAMLVMAAVFTEGAHAAGAAQLPESPGSQESYFFSVNAPGTVFYGDDQLGTQGPGELVTLKDIPTRKEVRKSGLMESGSSGVQPSRVLPTVVIVAGFNNISYQAGYDWNEEFFVKERSLRSYYLDQSYGQFTFEPAPETSKYGADGNTCTKDKLNDGVIHVALDLDHEDWGYGRSQNSVSMETMLMTAMNEAGAYIDYRSYDTNGNNKIDANELAICIIVAGYANETGAHSQDNTFYYHACSGLPDKATVPNIYNIQRCATMAECRDKNSQTIVINQYSTMCHELGHSLGLRDMYDTSSSGNRPWAGYASGFMSLMAMGNHGVDLSGEPLPTSLDPWCKIKLGYITPTVISDPGSYNVKAIDYNNITNKQTIFKIPVSGKEYYLIENRQFEKWDEGLPARGYSNGPGIVLWHIDDNYSGQQANNATHRPGNTPLYPEYASSGNGYTFIGTSVNSYLPFFNSTIWESLYKRLNGKFLNLPTFSNNALTAGPETREYSGIRLEFTSVSSADMTFRIVPESEHDHVILERRENEVPAKCETPGSYELVEYCRDCEEVFGRTQKAITKLGHDKQTVAKVWPTCEEVGYKKHNQCTRCGQRFKNGSKVELSDLVIAATGHDWDSGTVTKTPSCAEKGTRTYICGNDEEHTKNEDINMLPHTQGEPVIENEVAPTCEGFGKFDEVIYCTVCENELVREEKSVDPAGHTTGKTDKVDPDCENGGNIEHWQCGECNRLFRDEDAHFGITEQDTVLPPNGHDWDEPGYTWNGDKSRVTAKRVCTRDDSHFEEETVDTTSGQVLAPTCETKGKTKYTTKPFTNAAFTQQEETVEDIDALGHDITKMDEEPATCLEDGTEACWTCGTCRKMFSDGECTVEIDEPAVIPASGHDMEPVAAVMPTCEENGIKAHFECKACDQLFSDGAGLLAIDMPVIEQASGHRYGFTGFTWEGNEENGYTKATANYVCEHDDSHETTEQAAITATVTEPTCEAGGKTGFTATVGAGTSPDGELHEEKKDGKPTTAKGHDWDDGKVTTDPTCTEDGVKTFACGRDDLHTKTEIIPASGHDYGDRGVTKKATIEAEGEEKRVCRNDHTHVETRKTDKLVKKQDEEVKDTDGKTPSEDSLKKAETDKSLDIDVSEVYTTSVMKKNQMIVSWKKVRGATNYQISYRKVSDKNWTEIWSDGNNKVTLEKMKKNGLYQFKLMTVKKTGSGWQKSRWSKLNYRLYANTTKKVKPGKKSVKVTVKKVKKASGYEVLYGDSSKPGKMTVKSFGDAKKTKLTVKGLKSGKKYFVRSRPFRKYKGKKYVGILNRAKKVKVK